MKLELEMRYPLERKIANVPRFVSNFMLMIPSIGTMIGNCLASTHYTTFRYIQLLRSIGTRRDTKAANERIYIGDDMVIHFTRAAGQEIGTGTVLDKLIFSSSATPTGTICERCGDQSKLHGVIKSCIDCFLAGGKLYIFEYDVSTPFFIAKARGGTCTLAVSDPAEDALHRAKSLLDKGFGVYSLFKNNCEDFAIYCKTGLLIETNYSIGRSGQLASWTAAVSTVMSSPLRFLTTSGTGLVFVAGTMYSVGRYVADIGVRRDVIKIPVERLIVEAGAEEPQIASGLLTI